LHSTVVLKNPNEDVNIDPTALPSTAGYAGGDALCASQFVGGAEVLDVPEVMRCVLICLLEILKVMRCVLLCLLEALEVPEAMRCVLLCLLDVLEVPEAIHCVRLCLLEVSEVPEVMRCVLLVRSRYLRCPRRPR